MDYETLFECARQLSELTDSWLAAGCRLERWPLRKQLEDDLNRRRISLRADRDGRVGHEFSQPIRQETDLGLGGGFSMDARPGRTEAVSLFFQFITGPFQREVGRCKRCRKYFWNRWGHADKTYCNSRCGSAATAIRATGERRKKEHQAKLRAIKGAVQRFEQLSAETRSRRDWKRWVKDDAGRGPRRRNRSARPMPGVAERS
ncbi:MAG: hypothetical protein ABSH56_33485 [Bryobacteraceae bacterium]